MEDITVLLVYYEGWFLLSWKWNLSSVLYDFLKHSDYQFPLFLLQINVWRLLLSLLNSTWKWRTQYFEGVLGRFSKRNKNRHFSWFFCCHHKDKTGTKRTLLMFHLLRTNSAAWPSNYPLATGVPSCHRK